jgi:hypothetical protein
MAVACLYGCCVGTCCLYAAPTWGESLDEYQLCFGMACCVGLVLQFGVPCFIQLWCALSCDTCAELTVLHCRCCQAVMEQFKRVLCCVV